MKVAIKKLIKASIDTKQAILENEQLILNIDSIVKMVVPAFNNGQRVHFCGNGGSAADAQHLAAEFSGRFYKNRRALPSEALHCNTSYLTAVANDYSYDVIYARLVDGIMEKGDVLFGMSTSGNSKNIVKAFETARAKGIITVGFTGETGGDMKDLSDYLINIPSSVTPRIQEAHMLIGHIICELVEAAIFFED
ncbi:MAG: phosphoheptose isomerase [Bacteroidetes bacterium 24-39-8]|jgi:D-sedoheptulose 7-phosphate isomerase|nr:MAG: phosphoheptose isomerase [Sphingobacteriia bacterium 35-40-8]OYZ47866.1 MAG: phosphoheptose isomerase [Bacteroidetes bacterium 24-39-8]OZA69423.1 MAG: phosphoheptose isomerase [Sphingobacteriia bacterium 39-39-8]HQR93229.1 SIS domain-containing protein [Sediminibacterium sp.]HQS56363.1 SIS domain-containing protein [Sediminibacterium sp.]